MIEAHFFVLGPGHLNLDMLSQYDMILKLRTIVITWKFCVF